MRRRFPNGARPARARPAAALLLALAFLGAAAGPPGTSALDTVPPPARPLLHPTTKQLPPFPDDNPAALDPATWPMRGGGQGRLCALQLRTYARGVPVSLRSVRERKPGQPLSARYLCAERSWRGPRYAGPFYVWDGAGTLLERSYRTTDGTRYREDLYQYRPNGLVWAYRRRERGEDQSGPLFVLDEYYAADGRLAGFSLDRTGGAGPDSTLAAEADSALAAAGWQPGARPGSGEADSVAVRWRAGAVVDDATFRKWASDFAP